MGVAVVNHKTVQSESINDWIFKVKRKKLSLKRQRRKNLFVEAILTNALYKAELQLKSKQQQRLQRWRSIKTSLTRIQYPENTPSQIVWDNQTLEELDSLNQFMSKLKEIKLPVQR